MDDGEPVKINLTSREKGFNKLCHKQCLGGSCKAKSWAFFQFCKNTCMFGADVHLCHIKKLGSV